MLFKSNYTVNKPMLISSIEKKLALLDRTIPVELQLGMSTEMSVVVLFQNKIQKAIIPCVNNPNQMVLSKSVIADELRKKGFEVK